MRERHVPARSNSRAGRGIPTDVSTLHAIASRRARRMGGPGCLSGEGRLQHVGYFAITRLMTSICPSCTLANPESCSRRARTPTRTAADHSALQAREVRVARSRSGRLVRLHVERRLLKSSGCTTAGRVDVKPGGRRRTRWPFHGVSWASAKRRHQESEKRGRIIMISERRW